ncbi:MAG: FAD-dependent oxidoreductase, partial [Janibacter sp.]
FRHRVAETGVDVKLGVRVDADDLSGFDEVAVATGVTPRVPELPGVNHPSVVGYLDVLRGQAPVGERVAVLGAGGIGFDVAAFITDPGDEASLDIAAFQRTWGVDGDHTTRGGLTSPSHRSAPRQVTLLQRKTSKVGAGLGKTTGWIHRSELKQRGVTMVPGVAYERIDDEGLHLSVDGEAQVLDVDTIVLCTGQDPERGLHDALTERGVTVHLIGGADVAAELDAKRAIDQGTRLAAAV